MMDLELQNLSQLNSTWMMSRYHLVISHSQLVPHFYLTLGVGQNIMIIVCVSFVIGFDIVFSLLFLFNVTCAFQYFSSQGRCPL